MLESDFAALSSRGGNNVVNGVLSIVTGGLSVTLGFVIEDEFLSSYLFVFGGAGIAQGIIEMALLPNPSDSAIAFSHMPMGTMGEVEARLRYGEEELESIADRTRLARILDSSINIGSGVAIVPLYLGPKDFDVDAIGVFVLIGAGISVASGLVNLLTRSEAERRWASYRDLRDRLTQTEETRGIDVGVGAMPLPGGGVVSLRASF